MPYCDGADMAPRTRPVSRPGLHSLIAVGLHPVVHPIGLHSAWLIPVGLTALTTCVDSILPMSTMRSPG